jgi:serine/threonine protein kinase
MNTGLYDDDNNNFGRNKLYKGNIMDYVIGKEIGKGAYAIVKQAIHKPSGQKVAIKFYEKVKLMDPLRKTAVKKEIQIMKQLNHDNIVKMCEVIDTPRQVKFIMT